MGRPRKSSNETSEKDQEVPVGSVGEALAATVATDEVPAGIKIDTKDEYTIEVIKDYDGKIDPFYLSKKDPVYEYRFLRNDFKNLSQKTNNMLLQHGGWQLVPREHLKKIGVAERFIGPDGLYHVGETVLARIPKELFEEKKKYKKELASSPMNAIRRLINKGDPSTGGKEMHSSMKGIQTKDQLKFGTG
jgi:hypothetical protein